MDQSVTVVDDVRELLRELDINVLEEVDEDIPAWPTRILDEQLDCYRITNNAIPGKPPYGFNMTVPLNRRCMRQWGDKVKVEVQVSDNIFSYVSPMQLLRPDVNKMIVKSVKIPGSNMNGQVNFRRMGEDGQLEPTISDEQHKEIIKALLERLLPDETYGEGFHDRITGDQVMDLLWMPAFTHESYNPNIGMNYERLEFLGDAVMETSFRTYLVKKFPNFTQGEYTSMASHYLSTVEQSKLADNLGIMNAIRSNIVPNARMAEDVMEAFYGVLLHLTGFQVINKFTEEIYRDIDVDPRYRLQDHKTNVVQYFGRRSMLAPTEVVNSPSRGQYQMRLVIPNRSDLDKLLEYIPQLSWSQSSDGYVIAEGEVRRSQRSASSSVYDVMFDIIEEFDTFELPIPQLDPQYQRCLDDVYGEHYHEYQVITLRDRPVDVTLAIQARNRTTNLLDNIITMTIPIFSGTQTERRGATLVFLRAICDALTSSR